MGCSAPFAGEEGLRIFSSNDGPGNPARFCGKCTATYFSAITGIAYLELSDLVLARDLMWLGSPAQLRDYVSHDVKSNHWTLLFDATLRISSNSTRLSTSVKSLCWTLLVDAILEDFL